MIPIIGARKLTQIEDNIRSLDVTLSPAQIRRLDKATAVFVLVSLTITYISIR